MPLRERRRPVLRRFGGGAKSVCRESSGTTDERRFFWFGFERLFGAGAVPALIRSIVERFANAQKRPALCKFTKRESTAANRFVFLLAQQAATRTRAQRTALKIIAAASAQRNGDVYARYSLKRRRLGRGLAACKTLAKVKRTTPAGISRLFDQSKSPSTFLTWLGPIDLALNSLGRRARATRGTTPLAAQG